MAPWTRPGGKLREKGAEALSEAELLAVLIGTGIPGHSAVQIADDVLERFGSLSSLGGRPLEDLLTFKGLSDRKIVRIAAAFEIARRVGRTRP